MEESFMKKYPFMQVDAFTDHPLGGNPCAILFNTDDLDNKIMLAIAKEMNLSETSFVRSSQVADFSVRYFTPAEEIPLAGHPTIATTFALVETGRFKLTGERTTLTLELQVGPIEVEVIAKEGQVQQIIMKQKKPQFLNTFPAQEIMPVFNLLPDDLLPGVPIQTVSTGTPQLMIPLTDINVLKRAQINIPAYEALRQQSDFFSPHLFVLEGATPAGDTFARHFGVPPDTPEDPFTGSATGGMAAYLWHHGLLNNPNFVAEQGHWMGRPGVAQVEIIGPRQDIETVKVGGRAASVLIGEFYL
jgi:trans-2,3-dihydro-3-hydroxyanthranilate isomerase